MAKLTVFNACCGTRLRRDGCHGPLILADSESGEACCCCSIAGVTLRYAAGGGDGHQCDTARFSCYAFAVGGDPVFIGDVNLNNGATGAEVVVVLTITDQQSQEITGGADDCCILNLRLVCSTPPGVNLGWGVGLCHTNLARLIVTGKDADNQNVVLFNGQSGENTISLNACPQ